MSQAVDISACFSQYNVLALILLKWKAESAFIMTVVILAVFVLAAHMVSPCLYEHRALSGIHKDVSTTDQCGSQQPDTVTRIQSPIGIDVQDSI